jgi:hypothetical protein
MNQATTKIKMEVKMKKRFFAILSIFAATIILVAAVPGCEEVPPEEATILVKATLCGDDYEGATAYSLTADGEDPQNGTTVPGSHTVAPGTWTCSPTVGPPGSILIDVTPDPTQAVTAGGNITFTINFDKGQDVQVSFIEFTINGEPAEWYNPSAPEPVMHEVGYGDIIDVHFEQRVVGCDGHTAVVNETAGILVFYMNWMEGIGEPVPDQWFLFHAANDDCAVNKTGDIPAEKISQKLTWWAPNGTPMGLEYCDVIEHLMVAKNTTELLAANLDHGTYFEENSVWQVTKNVDYEKSINWLTFLPVPDWPPPEASNVLLHFVPSIPPEMLPQMWLVMPFLNVQLVDAEDINPANNYYEGYYAPLVFWVPGIP